MLAAGALTIPGELAFARSPLAAGVIQVPTAGEHVRHGLFAVKAISHPSLPAWLQVFERHLFYGDGISRGASDMYSFAFKARDTYFTVVQKGLQLSVLVNDQCHGIDPGNTQEVMLCDAHDLKACARTYKASGEIILPPDAGALVLLNGNLHCETEVAKGPSVIFPRGIDGQTLRALTPCAVVVLAQS